MAQDAAAISEVIQTYFDGLYEGDADKLGAIFLPTSDLASATDGQVATMTRDEWLAAVRARPSPVSQNLEREDEILSVDQSSPTTAFVKVRCAIPPRFFTDYLSLLKSDGRWIIAQKVFAVVTKPAG